MSDENLELMRRYYDAWNRGDLDAMRELVDPEMELDRSRSIGPDGGVYSGAEEILAFAREWLATWEDYRSDVEELIASGERVLVFGTFRGTGRGSGADVEAKISQVFTIREGRIVRHQLFQSRADAFEAAGLNDPDS